MFQDMKLSWLLTQNLLWHVSLMSLMGVLGFLSTMQSLSNVTFDVVSRWNTLGAPISLLSLVARQHGTFYDCNSQCFSFSCPVFPQWLCLSLHFSSIDCRLVFSLGYSCMNLFNASSKCSLFVFSFMKNIYYLTWVTAQDLNLRTLLSLHINLIHN